MEAYRSFQYIGGEGISSKVDRTVTVYSNGITRVRKRTAVVACVLKTSRATSVDTGYVGVIATGTLVTVSDGTLEGSRGGKVFK